MKSVSLIMLFNTCLVCMSGYGQDSTKSLPEVQIRSYEIIRLKALEISSQSILRDQILMTQPQDVGTILQKFSGTTLKSYGGLGGLKTISVRGLGSQHTAYTVDGFSISNTQTGQINLGQIQTDNVESIVLSTGSKSEALLPVSSYVNGSVVSIRTFENALVDEPFSMRFAARIGSFGESDNYLSLKFTKQKVFGSVFGKYRQANGNYGYSLQNGTMNYEGIRVNNDLQDWYSGAVIGFRCKNDARIRMIYKANGADQGLPGAVILYNSTANQRLSTQNQTINIDFNHAHKEFYYRFFGSYNYDWLHYTDPSFLNNTGGISTEYINNSYQFGTSFQRRVYKQFLMFGGLESRYNDLSFSTPNSAIPKRLHSYLLTGITWNTPAWTSEVQISVQQIMEENKAGERAENRLRVNPFLALEKEAFGKWEWKLKAWYRNSFRMPSFNELYYNGIGNVKLKPEEAQQFSLGFSVKPIRDKSKLEFTANGFANRIENQILAIPTKNLFVWSMQNIGCVNTFGSEVRVNFQKSFRSFWYIDAVLNYTYQYSVDVSKKTSPTYLNQVAYIPRHTGNFDWTLKRRNTGIHISATASSLRYSLMENIPANQVAGFAIFDVGIFSKVTIKKEHAFRMQFTVKNITNTSYAYIRYFVMPGRNYLLTLSYAIH